MTDKTKSALVFSVILALFVTLPAIYLFKLSNAIEYTLVVFIIKSLIIMVTTILDAFIFITFSYYWWCENRVRDVRRWWRKKTK